MGHYEIKGLGFTMSTYIHLEVQGNGLSSLWNEVYLFGSKNITWCKTVFLSKSSYCFIMTKIWINKLLILYLYV